MQIRVFQVGGGSRRGSSLVVGLFAVGAGILFVSFGLILLAALATVGVVAGAGALLLRALRGPRRAPDPQLRDGWRATLDPRFEVRVADDDDRGVAVGGQRLDPANRIEAAGDVPSAER
jgi:hypothetical protein